MEEPIVQDVPAQTVIALQRRGSHNEIGEVYRELHAWARAHDVTVRGNGLTIFLDPPQAFDPKWALFEVCLPAPAGVQADEKVAVKTLPACRVASVRVKGPYKEIPAHYTELLAWIDYRGWSVAGAPREVYRKRPRSGDAGKPDDYLTEIQFPIEE